MEAARGQNVGDATVTMRLRAQMQQDTNLPSLFDRFPV